MKSVVLVEVEGGVAYHKVIRGDVEVVEIDWDILKDGGQKFMFVGARQEIERLPEGDERNRMLSELERIAQGEVYRWAHLGQPLMGQEDRT